MQPIFTSVIHYIIPTSSKNNFIFTTDETISHGIEVEEGTHYSLNFLKKIKKKKKERHGNTRYIYANAISLVQAYLNVQGDENG